MSEYADACDHINVTEEAGGLFHCQDCGETRQSILWPREFVSDDDDRDIDLQLSGRWEK